MSFLSLRSSACVFEVKLISIQARNRFTSRGENESESKDVSCRDVVGIYPVANEYST